MAAPKGHPKWGGRQKGSLNKRSAEFKAILAEEDFCPTRALIKVYRSAEKIYDSYGEIYQAIQKAKSDASGYDVPVEDKAHVYLKIMGDSAKELHSYAVPKLKAIEHKADNALEDMTPEQKLEAMKQAVKFLEAQVKDANK